MKFSEGRSRLSLEHCQIKSVEILKDICKAIDIIEKLSFIRSGEIMFRDCFVCPDIDLAKFYEHGDPTEQLVSGILMSLHVQTWGKNSNPAYIKKVEERGTIVKIAKGIKPIK